MNYFFTGPNKARYDIRSREVNKLYRLVTITKSIQKSIERKKINYFVSVPKKAQYDI